MIWKRTALKWALLSLLAGVTLWSAVVGTQLYHHAQRPADAVLVLGGSIRRELFIAQSVAAGNPLPVLISQGSQPPCIRILFDRVAAPTDTVWLETCAESTFDNYRYSLPTLQQWKVHHIQVVTSASHLPRARWLAAIMLGSHGIWTEVTPVVEQGVPANSESPLKTALDLTRALGWAVLSQLYNPHCDRLFPLMSVDVDTWKEQGFKCEHQADITLAAD